MSVKSEATRFLTLDGEIFKLSTVSGKLRLDKFDKSSRTFTNVSDKFTGSSLWEMREMPESEIPAEVLAAA